MLEEIMAKKTTTQRVAGRFGFLFVAPAVSFTVQFASR